MDFASLMKAQLAKGKTEGSQGSKYIRRGEAEAQRQENYKKEQEAAEASRREKELKRQREEDDERERAARQEAKRRKLAEDSRVRREEEEAREEAARRKRLGLPPLPKKSASESETPPPEGEDVPDEQLISELRKLKEPAKLFGESHAARLRRYKALTAPKKQLSNTPIPTSLQLLPESEQQVPAKPPPAALKAERVHLYSQLASYFTLVLSEWSTALAARSAEVKESFQGKQASQGWVSSRENMRPLFKQFEKAEIDDAVLDGVVEIVNAAQRRRYVDANDAYLRLSIGKAAWPIGVTMVGIHERSAREKLHEHDQRAHIMSDEVTRKYLQAIKQCLSFAQTRWPPDDHLQLMG